MTDANRLNPAVVQAQLRACAVGHTLHYHERVASTMPLAHTLARQATTRSGTLVIAEEQTAGRGRLQRRWEAPAGQALLISVILKPPDLPAAPRRIPMLAGVALARALVAVAPDLDVQLKWPNDVLLVGATGPGKVAGILIETAYRGTDLAYAIVGTGINVNQAATDLPVPPAATARPTSLRAELGRVVDRTALLTALCRELARGLANAGSEALFAQWRALLATLGQTITVYDSQTATPPFTGRALAVTPDGDLIVETPHGQRRTFQAGDVSLRPAG